MCIRDRYLDKELQNFGSNTAKPLTHLDLSYLLLKNISKEWLQHKNEYISPNMNDKICVDEQGGGGDVIQK